MVLDGAVRISLGGTECLSSQCDTKAPSRVKRSAPLFNDPMYNLQWYLNDNLSTTSMNVIKAWEAGYNGDGIVISVVDTGIQANHDEFKLRYDQNASYNFVKSKADPTPNVVTKTAQHGTLVAGVAAGEANNGKCGVGVAYKAKIGGINFIDSEGGGVAQGDDVEQKSALSFKQDYIDIYACAWGPDDTIGIKVGYNKAAAEIENGTRLGRNGKGNIYVFAAGNEGLFNDSCTYDGYVSDVNTFGITNINHDGTPARTSERCPGIVAAAYTRDGGQGVEDKTYLMPSANLDNKCGDTFSASSAATAVASGIFALVLQANPALTWRDLYHIVAHTSQNNETVAKNGEWHTNAAGFRVSHRYGFGILDAMAMIETAKNWTNVPDRITCENPFTVSESLPKAGGSALLKKINVKDCGIDKLEHVVLVLNFTCSPRKNLEVVLTSPRNTKSFMLMSRRFDTRENDVIMYPTMTLHNWGESPVGDWNVSFRNVQGNEMIGELSYYNLILYGTSNGITTTAKTSTTTKTTKPGSSSIQTCVCLFTFLGTIFSSIYFIMMMI